MPFQSERQRRYMHANLPAIARRWEREEKAVAGPAKRKTPGADERRRNATFEASMRQRAASARALRRRQDGPPGNTRHGPDIGKLLPRRGKPSSIRRGEGDFRFIEDRRATSHRGSAERRRQKSGTRRLPSDRRH